jgi:hypothetical protein
MKYMLLMYAAESKAPPTPEELKAVAPALVTKRVSQPWQGPPLRRAQITRLSGRVALCQQEHLVAGVRRELQIRRSIALCSE